MRIPTTYTPSQVRKRNSKVENLAEASEKRNLGANVIVIENTPKAKTFAEDEVLLIKRWETDENGKLIHFDVVV